jgi:hypothetical protein
VGRAFAWALVVGGAAFLLLGAAAILLAGLGALLGGGFLAAMGAAFFAVGRARLQPRVEAQAVEGQPVHALPPPVPPLPAEALAAVREPVKACPRCGSLDIQPARMQEGAYAGGGELLSIETCARCHFRGLAVVFDRRADYAEFLEELHRGGVHP